MSTTGKEPLIRRIECAKDFKAAKDVAMRSYWRAKGKYAAKKLKDKGFFDEEFDEALDSGRGVIFVSPDGSEQVKFYATWSRTMEAMKIDPNSATAAEDSDLTQTEEA